MNYFKKPTVQVLEKYKPKKTNKTSEKTLWTENRLQEEQHKLFELFKTCGKAEKGTEACKVCPHRKCDAIVSTMSSYLTPYGESIYKRTFKYRSTLEEYSRVVTESVNSLLMDVWEKGKLIHSSFGSMLRWKILHYLDGKINLFDSERVQSIDGMVNDFEDTNPNATGEDLIEYVNEMFIDASSTIDTFNSVIRKDTIQVILKLMETSYNFYNRYSKPREKYAMYLKTFYGVNRFLQGKNNLRLFENDSRAKYYYTKLLDVIFSYLDTYKRIT